MVDVIVRCPARRRARSSELTTPLERTAPGGCPEVRLHLRRRPEDSALRHGPLKVNEPLEPSLDEGAAGAGGAPRGPAADGMRPMVRALTIDDVPFLALNDARGGRAPRRELAPGARRRGHRRGPSRTSRRTAERPVPAARGARRRRRNPDPACAPCRSPSAEITPGDPGRPGPATRGRARRRRTAHEAAGLPGSSLRREFPGTSSSHAARRPAALRRRRRPGVDGPGPEPAVVARRRGGEHRLEQAVSMVVAKRPDTNQTEPPTASSRRSRPSAGGCPRVGRDDRHPELRRDGGEKTAS